LLLLLWSMLHSNCPALFQAVGMHHSSWGYCFKRHSIGGKTCISILKWSNFGWFGGSPWVPHVRKPPILWYSYPIGWAVLRCKCLRRWVLSWSSLLSADGATGPVHWVQWYPMISLYWNTNNLQPHDRFWLSTQSCCSQPLFGHLHSRCVAFCCFLMHDLDATATAATACLFCFNMSWSDFLLDSSVKRLDWHD